MRTIPRTSFTSAALALVLGVFAATTANAQTIPAQEAQAFMGNWTLAIDAQGQAFTMDVSITNDGGNAAAEVTSEMGSQKVSKIEKAGEKLVLSFTMDAQGQSMPIAITLAQAEGGLNADIDVAGGMFMATGKGTKK